MEISQRKRRVVGMCRVVLIGILAGGLALPCAAACRLFKEKLEGVSLTGIHHMGIKFKVDEFVVDGTDGGNVGWEGGGGSTTCCVELPRAWRPGLSVLVRWAVSDWSEEVSAETDKGNYRSVLPGGIFRARIPVEKYEKPEHLYVHFFAGGKARVVSSFAGKGIYHPIADNDPSAAELATSGSRVDSLYTKGELAEIHRKAEARTRRFGDWR